LLTTPHTEAVEGKQVSSVLPRTFIIIIIIINILIFGDRRKMGFMGISGISGTFNTKIRYVMILTKWYKN
jgi:hypothetical protein